MSRKNCRRHENKLLWVVVVAVSSIIVVLVLLAVFVVWIVLRPTKPQFTLQDATIFNLNVTAPNVISIVLQITVVARNPNSKIGIYYDGMDTCANYRSQQITYVTQIPPVYQGHKCFNVWSPFVNGNDVPVAPFNGYALRQDAANGAVELAVNINGAVRWRVGEFVSGPYHLHVICPAYIPIGNKDHTGIVVGNAVKYLLSQPCSVNV